jgi:2-polyprenyl-3-methyl-5-hydroxy-6-metoxy-1,4-benzoquinol methylase
MPELDTSTAKLTRFYGELSPSLRTVKESLAVAGIDPAQPRARDLYERDIDCHNLGMYPMLERLAEIVAEYGVPTQDDAVLDLGCGIGGPSRFLADRFDCSVLGVDLLSLRIELAEALAELTNMRGRVSYRVADATDLDMPDQSFDQVWMLDVSIHIRNKRALFGEIARVLRPDGLMVMHEQTGPLPAAMRPVMRQAPYIAPSLPQLIRYVEDAGLRILTWRDTTSIVIEYFLKMRNLVLNASESQDSRRKSGIPILDGYIETLAQLGGRTGAVVARRTGTRENFEPRSSHPRCVRKDEGTRDR